MAKMAKKIQTDYTKGGRDISNTAVPLYQDTLNAMGDYNKNPQQYIDSYLNKYYTDTTAQNDFLRDANRTLANATARNYSATGGGYSSAGQRSYDDTNRYLNDRLARLYDAGVQSAAGMAQQYYNNLLNGAGTYHNAYGLGKDYSDVQQYNNAVSQNNSILNQVGQVLPQVGGAVGSIWGPVGRAIGSGVGSLAGGFMTTDVSGITGAGSNTGSVSNTGDIFGDLNSGISTLTKGKLWGKTNG